MIQGPTTTKMAFDAKKGYTNGGTSAQPVVRPTIPPEESMNPWNVFSLFEFSYFCCPECNFKIRSDNIEQSAQDFVNHASHNHPWAVPYLQQINDGSLDDVIFSEENNVNIKVEIEHDPKESEEEFFQDEDGNFQGYLL